MDDQNAVTRNDTTLTAEPPPFNDSINFRITAAIVASALFMQNVDGTVVATALPSMARDMHTNAVYMSSAITSYLISLTVFIPLSGWVADRFGARRVFMWAIAIFTVSSCLCALTGNVAELVIARLVQGIGGAMMVPVARLLVFRSVRRDQLLSATTWLTMPAMIGPLAGPPLGGVLTDAWSWQSVFWINLPVGIAGLLLTYRYVPAVPGEDAAPPDLRGMLLVGGALTALMIGIETIGRGLVATTVPIASFVVGGSLAWVSVRHCRKTAHPILDLDLLAIPTFNVATLGATLFRAGAGALPFLVPMLLQLGFGLSAATSGTISLASALGSLCMKSLTRFALHWFSVRAILITSTLLFAIMLAVCATLSARWSASAIFALLLFGGLTRSLNFACIGALAFADVPKAKLSSATSFQGIAQQLPKAMGVAIAAGALQVSMSLANRTNLEHGDFVFAFLTLAVVVALSIPSLAGLPAEAGDGISQPAKRRTAQPDGSFDATLPRKEH
ncbi:MFS transporter [Caballeronia sp. 15711]|uniref:MFS transporter n=1 Tax=Caballeronia sp. 15711 TaxID=3391029 RepID=UPI0039E291F9